MLKIAKIIFSPSGRISLLGFWIYWLIFLMVYLGVHFLVEKGGGGQLALIFLIPLSAWSNIVVYVKRCHDRDRRGWWLLIALIPLVGLLWLIVDLWFLPGSPGSNRFGVPAGHVPEEQSSQNLVYCPRGYEAEPQEEWATDVDREYGRTLGLSACVSFREIKKAYRMRAAEYHPDKVAHLGESLQAVADVEMKRINEAYEHFRKSLSV